ncbi:undecaprenyl-diphosphatase [Micromonospora pallida]|uniref:Undecaprenyl-diphosphatase n=1 Tax=Micromonospora pallida TaxID=145854 RepID=A0A1C6T861_9ACTN|nr:phosphatase PAP2 family protein [Micromonospora pallida]SCL38006.1 undecaprenyl-diphosphatase [Micromonospora pallida]
MVTSQTVDTWTGVPGFSEEWYRDIVEFAGRTPEPVRWFAAHFTEGSIVLLVLLFLLASGRRFGGTSRDRAATLVAPVAVVLAYGLSEWIKTLVDQERPCRALTDLVIVAGHCPPPGDWSFPSNHSTIAGALAATTLLLRPRLGLLAVPLALLAAFSRTFVGVHYPHDVVGGLLLGTLVGTVLLVTLSGPVAHLLDRRRTGPPAGTRTPTGAR